MKGLISGIKRMEIHDGDGMRTTVFLKGCPLKCIWCHNPESIGFQPQVAYFKEKCIHCGLCKEQRTAETAELCPVEAQSYFGKEYDVETLADVLQQDKPFFETSGGGVTMSGGECLAQPEFAVALAKELKSRGISVYVDTCGFVKRETYERIIPYVDKFLYDVKAIDPAVHKRCTGQENGIILENLKYLSDQGCSIEIRYPLVKGYNDGEAEKIGAFLKDLNITKIKVLQYHHYAGSRYDALGMENTLPDTETTMEDMDKAVKILKGYGLNAVNGAKDD